MQRFFFHLNSLQDVVDLEGSKLESLEDARAEALASIRDILSDRLRGGSPVEVVSVRICNEAGELLDEVYVDEVLRRVFPPETLVRLIRPEL